MGNKMKAARLYGIRDIRVEEVLAPAKPENDQVLLRVLAAGICGSDLHNFKTGQWFAHLPVTPGHEFCAEVISVGPSVNLFKPGDWVAADSRANCGECDFCKAGRGNLCRSMGFVGEVCDGGFAEYTVLPEKRLHQLPKNIAPEIAVLSEPLGVALRVIKQLNAPSGAQIAVTGGGTIGGLVTLLLREVFHHPVILFEKNEFRKQLLRQSTNFDECTFDRDALMHRTEHQDVNYWIEATGSSAVMQSVISLAGKGSRIALVGLFSSDVALDINRIVEGEVQIIGSSVFCDEQKEAIKLLPLIAEKLKPLISVPIAIDAIPDIYQRLCEGKVTELKTVINPGV